MEGNGFAEGYAVGSDRNNCCNNSGFGWGGDWAWLIILFALFGGWGNNGGFGWGGNNCGCNGNLNYELGKVATSNDVAVGFAQNATLSSLNDLKLGQAGIQQTLCQGFNGVNTAILQGNNTLQNAICQLGYEQQNCCCQTQRAIDGVNYNMAQNTCNITNAINTSTRDIIDNQRDGTNAILNFLTQDKISTLQAENQALKFQASQTAQNAFITANQEAQTAEIIRRLGRDCPVPAYVVPNPNCCYPNGYGYSNGCGCNSGCGCGC